ncbi:MAG: translocation/assembly module TamB domain-containing protein, partial [Thermoanaerobaculia bacterium]
RYFDGITVEGAFTLRLSGDADRAVLQGEVDVTRALYFRDLDLGSSLLTAVLSRRGPSPITPASWQDHVSLRVHLVAADSSLAIKNNLADVTASGDLELTGTLANPSVTGLVSLDEGGKVRFQTIDYRLVRGSINFQNPFRIDPFFDVTLEARVNGGLSEVESGPIDLTVTLTGTIDRMTPSITSDPPASDITLFSLVGLGGLAGKSNGAPQDATGAGKSLLFQSISLLGSKVFSFADSFTIDPSDISQTGDPGPKVSFAKRLSNQVRVLVVYNTKDSKKRIVLEWQVNPEWLVQTTADELKKEARLEGRFRRRYEGHWTWGSRGRNPLQRARSDERAPGVAAPALIAIAPTTDVAPAQGAQVVSVSLRADSQIDTSRFTQYLSVRPNEPLTIRAVQKSVRSLFATGDFRDIRVNEAAVPGGVAITFGLFTNFRVTAIRFDGLSNGDRERASRALTFHLGDVLSLNAVDHSAVALQSFLNRDGYLESAVDPETKFSRGEGRAEVSFHVARGARATVGTVSIDGNVVPFKTDDLVHQMKRGPGKSFQLSSARSDAERMRTWLIRRDYRKANVQFEKYTYDAATKQVALQYSATSGPVVKVEVAGIGRRSIRSVLPFSRNQAYSEDVIDKATGDIVTLLQQRGFYNVTADTEESLKDNIWTTTFRVSPGEQFKLAAVTFTGNQKVSDKTLAPVVQTSASSGFVRSLFTTLSRRATGVTRSQLSSDRDALESYYKLQGFSEATVAPAVVKTDQAKRTMLIDFPIVEGPQTMVAEVRIEGAEQVSLGKLPKPSLKAGQPLDPQQEHADVVALQSFYSDRGNVEAQVQAREEISTDKTSARITYVVAEGPTAKFGDIVVRGNTYTKPSVVLRTSQLDKGEPFSYTSLLEAQRNLYRLGIFQRVEVQPEQTGTSVAERSVTIAVEEGKDLSFAGSVGITSGISGNDTSPSLLGSVAVAHRNLFGTGRYLGLELVGTFNPSKGKVATGGRQEAFLTYREPYVGPFNIPIQVTAFQSDTLRRGAHLRQRGTFIEATRVARYRTRWSLRYEYRISQCIVDNPTGDVCSLLANALLPGYDRTFANIKISSLTPTFFWDKRDDSIDPHRGFFTSASLEYAFKALNADARFLKEFTQASWYLPVSNRSVLALSGRVGLIKDLDRGFTSEGLARTGVPLSERFTGGGDTSHRGFPLDLLGTTCADPRDTELCTVDAAGRLRGATLVDIVDEKGKHTIAPIGGRSVFIMNAEYRFPLAGTFGGTLFTDIGNVFDETRIQFGNLRYGVGTGVRYLSPVGPVRFDLGYKLNRRILRFDEIGKPIYEKPLAYFITLGYAF